eukprot:422524_1
MLPSANQGDQIRLSWKVGSFCLIRSRSEQKWYNAQIVAIITTDTKEEKETTKQNNEWLIVKYKKNKKTKRIQRMCKDIKPIVNNNNILLKKGSFCLIYSNVLNIWC